MLCDVCKERESVISYTRIKDDGIEEVHLCEVCAEEKFKRDFKGIKILFLNLKML